MEINHAILTSTSFLTFLFIFVAMSSSSSLPVINTSKSAPVVAQSVSSPVEMHIASDDDSSSSSTADSDSDDETVYADTKDDLNTEGHDPDEVKQRPSSVLSDVSNSHTDNTLISTENLADTDDVQQQNKNSSNSNVTDSENEAETFAETDESKQSIANPPPVIPQVEVKVHSASSSDNDNDDSHGDGDGDGEQSGTDEIEQSNIDDIVLTPPPVVGDVVMNDECDTKFSLPATESEIETASKVVDEAMKAALDQFKSEQSDTGDEQDEGVDEESHPVIDCDNIDIDVTSDSEPAVTAANDGAAPGGGEIDDSDESDALSASSLD